MVEGLDGVEKRIYTINPETNKFDVYICSGYYNTARFVGGKLVNGKLVDWYRPLSGEGQYHSLEFLELLHKTDNRPLEIRVKGQEPPW